MASGPHTESEKTPQTRRAVGPWSDLELHTIGWRAFQDLCSQVCEVVLRRPVEIFREAQDGGQDAVFLIPSGAHSTRVGTVQCKHTSDASKALKLSDLKPELDHVRILVSAGQADTYVFMTNMSLDAPVAAQLSARLRELGVRKPHIWGRQHIVRTIRSSARLRALVPQVYGLGDLTAILDERVTEQSRALLDSWIPKLRTYVPTQAHRDAVHAIMNHGVVLLLGNPSSGKSTIGAIISTIFSDKPDSTVLALTSPRDFEAGWNPNDPGRFFWIDDAFGSNVVNNDHVQQWASAFTKVRAAIAHGNRFLLTSRKYIYEAASRRLGQRNLQEFRDGSAVVDVGDLTLEEKSQILYNHINFGNQSKLWRGLVKPYMAKVASVDNFLPGIAERLGDRNFTKDILPQEVQLVRFMQEPREHLIDTLNALDEVLLAALLLVYVHQAGFHPVSHDPLAAQAITDLTGFSLQKIQDTFMELKGSFLKFSMGKWTFSHPSISDALTEILREKPHMMAALIRGATIGAVLDNFACEGSPATQYFLVIPSILEDALVDRVLGTPDDLERNWKLFQFLAYRSSDAVFKKLIRDSPELLDRKCWTDDLLAHSPKIISLAKAKNIGLLPHEIHLKTANQLEISVIEDFDVSILEDNDILSLISPRSLINIGLAIRTTVLPSIMDKIQDIYKNADLDSESDTYFGKITSMLDWISNINVDAEGEALISEARDEIAASLELIEERKNEYKSSLEDDTDWDYVVPEKRILHSNSENGRRSIFDDMDL